MFLIDGLGAGGKERQLVELLKGLTQSNAYDIKVISTERDTFYLPDIMELGIPVHFITRSVRWDPWILVKIFKYVNDYKPHIIHTFGLVPSFYALPIAKYKKITMINGSIRNTFYSRNFKLRLERFLLSCSDYVIANSKTGLTCRGFIESDTRIVIYNGFDFARMKSVSDYAGSRFSFPAGKKVVGMVAEFSDYKDQKTFVSAALRILESRSDIYFVLVGDGKHLDACRKMAEQHSWGIQFLGRRKNVETIIEQFNIGVLTSFTEGISNSVMEYMAAGKPVIATDGGATHELVHNGTTGFLIPCGDVKGLMEKIELLIDDPHLAEIMGEMGRRRLMQNFSLESMTCAAMSLYTSILERPTCH
jgi:glycosyltransferase involved in cell wall biosynthesis